MADNLDPQQIDNLTEALNNLTATLGGDTATIKRQDIKNLEDLGKAVKENMLSYKGLTAGISTASKAFGELGSGAKGASQYNSAIDSGTTAVNKFAGAVGTMVGGPWGLLIKAVGLGTQALGKWGQAALKQSDALYKTYQDLNKAGAAGAEGMTGVFQNMQKFGYGIEQLGDMTSLLRENSEALAAFGGSAAQGAKDFANASSEIIHSNLGKSLMMLGKTPDDINKGVASFIRQQQQSGITAANINRDLAQSSAEYVKNLDLMSRLTGKNAEELQKNRDQAMAEDAFNQTIFELKKKGDKESLEKANELLKASDLLAKTPALQKDFWQAVGGDAAAMGKFLNMGGESARYMADKNFKAGVFYDKLQKDTERFSNTVGGLYKYNALDDKFLSAKERSEILSRNAGEAAEKRAKVEQDAAAKGADATTRYATELRINQMNIRDSIQSFTNAGVKPATATMMGVTKALDKVTGVPGAVAPGTFGTTTAKDIGGGAHVRGFQPGGGLPPNQPQAPKAPASGAAVKDILGSTPGLQVTPSGGKGPQQEFYTKMYGSLYKAAVEQGLKNPEVIAKLGAAQSSLETGYGKSTAGSKNYFGIKAKPGEEGSGGVATKEFINGKWVTINDKFRKYGSMEESASDYVKFLKENKRYKDVLGSGTLEEAIAAQGRTGYATDPAYASKLAGIASKYAGGIPAGPAGGYQATVAGLNPSAQLPTAPGPAAPVPGAANPQEVQVSLLSQISDKLDMLNKTSRQTYDVNDKILKRSA